MGKIRPVVAEILQFKVGNLYCNYWLNDYYDEIGQCSSRHSSLKLILIGLVWFASWAAVQLIKTMPYIRNHILCSQYCANGYWNRNAIEWNQLLSPTVLGGRITATKHPLTTPRFRVTSNWNKQDTHMWIKFIWLNMIKSLKHLLRNHNSKNIINKNDNIIFTYSFVILSCNIHAYDVSDLSGGFSGPVILYCEWLLFS